MAKKSTEVKKNEDIPFVCSGCLKWKDFGKSCWVYWEGKKKCSHHTSDFARIEEREIYYDMLKDYRDI